MRFIIRSAKIRIILTISILLIASIMSVVWAKPVLATYENSEDIIGSRYMDHMKQESREPEANLPFLFAVYTITWAGFFAYIFMLSRRQRDINLEIEYLKSKHTEIESKSQINE